MSDIINKEDLTQSLYFFLKDTSNRRQYWQDRIIHIINFDGEEKYKNEWRDIDYVIYTCEDTYFNTRKKLLILYIQLNETDLQITPNIRKQINSLKRIIMKCLL